jgi:Chaperone of endosialidase
MTQIQKNEKGLSVSSLEFSDLVTSPASARPARMWTTVALSAASTSTCSPLLRSDPDSVTITSAGRLGRGNVSSRRYKHDIQPMEKASEVLYALKPVSFRYNKEYDATQTLAFGLIAEEVAEVYPDLVGRNPKSEPESVRYEQINAMLLNEFLKEHPKVEKQEKEIAALNADLKEQRDLIQTVSKKVEVMKPAAQVASNA